MYTNVSGSVPAEHMPIVNGEVAFMAPRAADTRTGYSAQRYAFASEEQAFDGTPNRGTAPVSKDGTFHIELREPPSAYHLDFSRDLHPPHVVVMYMDREHTLRVSSLPIPADPAARHFAYKSLAHDPERDSPEYYTRRNYDHLPQVWYGNTRDGARTQEELLRAKVRAMSKLPREQLPY